MSYLKIILIGLAFLCFFVGMYIWLYPTIQSSGIFTGNGENNVNFLTKEETQELLNKDADHYYERFQKDDLLVRGVKSKEDYLEKIANSACDGDVEVEEKITDCIGKLQKRMAQLKNETIEGISIEKMATLPWKIGFTCDKNYENGLPHTRGDVILLNNRDVQTRTISEVCRLLLHEQTHVYQKQISMATYLGENYENINISESERKRIPANPDTDLNVYKDKKDGTVYMGQYEEKPKHFRDIRFSGGDGKDSQYEHPYEKIAYAIEKIYVD